MQCIPSRTVILSCNCCLMLSLVSEHRSDNSVLFRDTKQDGTHSKLWSDTEVAKGSLLGASRRDILPWVWIISAPSTAGQIRFTIRIQSKPFTVATHSKALSTAVWTSCWERGLCLFAETFSNDTFPTRKSLYGGTINFLNWCVELSKNSGTRLLRVLQLWGGLDCDVVPNSTNSGVRVFPPPLWGRSH